ncbi:MAG: hypothetical protein KDB00_25275 [Planctomycetales bacterium]|nr:hypothetical protein [Planctomycetales bacterium]
MKLDVIVFPVRSFLVGLAVITLLAGGCGKTHPVPENAEVEVGFLDQVAAGRSGHGSRIELVRDVADDAMLQTLTVDDTWIKTLILDAGVISDRGVQSIALLPKLGHLRLRESPISDVGLAEIAGCDALQILNLPQSDATSAGVAHLAELPDLKNLRIGGPRLDAETASAVASIKSLRNVHLINVPITDEGLRQIASLPKLQSIYLDGSVVTDEGWDWLFQAHPKLHVHVNQKHLDRDHANHGDDGEQSEHSEHSTMDGND